MGKPADRLRKQVREYLDRLSIFYWPVPASRLGAGGWQTSKAGLGDFTGVMPGGKHFEIEVKAEGDRLRKAQIEHRDRLLELGALYFVMTDIEIFAIEFGEHLKGR